MRCDDTAWFGAATFAVYSIESIVNCITGEGSATLTVIITPIGFFHINVWTKKFFILDNICTNADVLTRLYYMRSPKISKI